MPRYPVESSFLHRIVPAMARILHIIDRLSGAGPTRSLRASVQFLERLGFHHRHEVLTLKKPNYPPALMHVRQTGMTIHQAPDVQTASRLIAAADLVKLHYWHNPAFSDFLAGDWPPHRRLVWFKILGRHAPQVISPALLEVCDGAMVSSALSLELPAFEQTEHLRLLVEVVPGLMEPDRLDDLAPQPHDGFVVSYVGTANPTKMHSDFVEMSAAADIPEIRFVICGAGDPAALRVEAERLGSGGRFEFRGYVENIRPVLATTDVFGYPLCEDTWATSEKSLQEAMLAGIAPVVFPHGGIADMVEHGETGLVADSPSAYTAALEHLYRHPEERCRLGNNARRFVAQRFDGEQTARRIQSLYARLLERPRRYIPPLHASLSVAARFARHMLPSVPHFADSLRAPSERLDFTADKRVATSTMTAARGEGGIVHFRNTAPDDVDLLRWSGLVLAHQGHWEKALAEFDRAVERRPDDWRLNWYRAVAGSRVNGRDSARSLFAATLNHAERSGVKAVDLQCLTDHAGREPAQLFVHR